MGYVVMAGWLGVGYVYALALEGFMVYAEDLERVDTFVFWTVFALFSYSRFLPTLMNAKEGVVPTSNHRFVAILLYVLVPPVMMSHSYLTFGSLLAGAVLLGVATFSLFFLMIPYATRKIEAPRAGLAVWTVFIAALPLSVMVAWGLKSAGSLDAYLGFLRNPTGGYIYFSAAATFSMVCMMVGILAKVTNLKPDQDVMRVTNALTWSGVVLGAFIQFVDLPAEYLRRQARQASELGYASLDSGDLKTAQLFFERAVEHWPGSITAAEGLAETAVLRHDPAAVSRWRERVDLLMKDEKPLHGMPSRDAALVQTRQQRFKL